MTVYSFFLWTTFLNSKKLLQPAMPSWAQVKLYAGINQELLNKIQILSNCVHCSIKAADGCSFWRSERTAKLRPVLNFSASLDLVLLFGLRNVGGHTQGVQQLLYGLLTPRSFMMSLMGSVVKTPNPTLLSEQSHLYLNLCCHRHRSKGRFQPRIISINLQVVLYFISGS